MADQTHLIKSGDNLTKIATQYGTTVDALAKANNIKNPNLIIAGKTLNIPGAPAPTPAPAPAPAPVPAPTPAPTPAPGGAPTVADVYGGVYSADPDAAARKAAEDAAAAGYKAGAPSETDTYTKALNEYQDQIDAINSLYAGKRAEVTKQYTDMETQRMGSEGALLANTGMAGSTFGNSKTNELGIANENELKGAQDKVDAEKSAAIASVMGLVHQQADKSYADKLAAYTSGADKTIAFLKESATRNDTNATQVAQNSILKGLDLSDPKNFSIVQQIAKTMGVDPNFIIDKYVTAKKSYDLAATKAKQETDKAAADLAKTIAETSKATAETGAIPGTIAKTAAETAKIKSDTAKNYADIAKIHSDIATGGTYQSGGLKIGKADLSDIQNVLEKGNQQLGLAPKAQDGYANPYTYIQLYNHWVNPPDGKGGLAKDFVALFPPKTYLSPNDKTIPQNLQDAIKSTAINVVVPGVGQ